MYNNKIIMQLHIQQQYTILGSLLWYILYGSSLDSLTWPYIYLLEKWEYMISRYSYSMEILVCKKYSITISDHVIVFSHWTQE